jgi:hypothetical protein
VPTKVTRHRAEVPAIVLVHAKRMKNRGVSRRRCETARPECGVDRMLKRNTSKKRTRSLLNQGLDWYSAIRPLHPYERESNGLL